MLSCFRGLDDMGQASNNLPQVDRCIEAGMTRRLHNRIRKWDRPHLFSVACARLLHPSYPSELLAVARKDQEGRRNMITTTL